MSGVLGSVHHRTATVVGPSWPTCWDLRRKGGVNEGNEMGIGVARNAVCRGKARPVVLEEGR